MIRRWRRVGRVVAALAVAGPAVSSVFAQPAAKGPAVDAKAVDAAVDKGAAWLRGVLKKGIPALPAKDAGTNYEEHRHDELVLYTLHYAGVPRTDPDFDALLKQVLERPLRHTYNVAIRSLLLEAVDRVAYQSAIADGAQFLADAQCENGQWAYTGMSKPLPGITATAAGGKPDADSKDAVTPVYSEAKVKQPPVRIRRRGIGPPNGDNSNTQYGLLGLLAAQRANVRVPADIFARAKGFLDKIQSRDGGWGYGGGGGKSLTGYQSMTVGAVGSLAICDTAQRGDPRKDPAILKGVGGWLAKNFALDRNTGKPETGDWLYYQLYALERVGQLLETEKVGTIEWYPAGAQWLLKEQRADGSWMGPQKQDVCDTCFAILFLRRATRSLVAVETR